MTADQAKKLREPFPKSAIGKLPKGGVQLDYVGHAAVTDRLLSIDPSWTWEPLALSPEGLPALDRAGNLWIRMTICGVTRIGVGDGKNAKECISDAIRNAAMRFGVALDLWSKEEIGSGHGAQGEPATGPPSPVETPAAVKPAAPTAAQAPPDKGADGNAAPSGGAPTAADLTALYELVRAKGGDVDKTKLGAATAEERGKLAAWYATAKKHWDSQPDSFANKIPAGAA